MSKRVTISLKDELYNWLKKHNSENPKTRINVSRVCNDALDELRMEIEND